MTDGDYRLAASDLDVHDGGRNRPDIMHSRMEYGGKEGRREGKARGEMEGEGRRGRERTRSARRVNVDHAGLAGAHQALDSVPR